MSRFFSLLLLASLGVAALAQDAKTPARKPTTLPGVEPDGAVRLPNGWSIKPAEWVDNGKTLKDPMKARVKALEDHIDPWFRGYDLEVNLKAKNLASAYGADHCDLRADRVDAGLGLFRPL